MHLELKAMLCFYQVTAKHRCHCSLSKRLVRDSHRMKSTNVTDQEARCCELPIVRGASRRRLKRKVVRPGIGSRDGFRSGRFRFAKLHALDLALVTRCHITQLSQVITEVC